MQAQIRAPLNGRQRCGVLLKKAGKVMESTYLRILMKPKWLWRSLWSHKGEAPLTEVITDKGPILFCAGVIHWLKKPPYPKERTQARTWGAAVTRPSSASSPVRSIAAGAAAWRLAGRGGACG